MTKGGISTLLKQTKLVPLQYMCTAFLTIYGTPAIYHSKKYSASHKTRLLDELMGLLAVYWLPENHHCSELSTSPKRNQKPGWQAAIYIHGRKLVAIWTLHFRGFLDGMPHLAWSKMHLLIEWDFIFVMVSQKTVKLHCYVYWTLKRPLLLEMLSFTYR